MDTVHKFKINGGMTLGEFMRGAILLFEDNIIVTAVGVGHLGRVCCHESFGRQQSMQDFAVGTGAIAVRIVALDAVLSAV
jgi:hypothetical protein